MDFIDIRLRDGKGGFLIPDSDEGRKLAVELLKDKNYIQFPLFIVWETPNQ